MCFGRLGWWGREGCGRQSATNRFRSVVGCETGSYGDGLSRRAFFGASPLRPWHGAPPVAAGQPTQGDGVKPLRPSEQYCFATATHCDCGSPLFLGQKGAVSGGDCPSSEKAAEKEVERSKDQEVVGCHISSVERPQRITWRASQRQRMGRLP